MPIAEGLCMRFPLAIISLFLTHCGPPLEINWPKPKKEVSPQTSAPIHPWFKIIVLDVGQGDATILISPEGEAVLIDTGPSNKGASAILAVLEDQRIEDIQNIFISHHHEDHTGGLKDVLSKLKLDRSIVIDKNNAIVDQTVSLGPITIAIKATNGQIGPTFTIAENQKSDENNLSLALLIQYQTFKYFTDGDLPGGGGDPPYQTIDLETPLAPWVDDIDVFLVPHHGSHTSSNENFLNELTPEVGILSLGDHNDFFHPHPSVMRRLKERNIKIYQTEKGWLSDSSGITIMNDHICILSDGERYLIEPYHIDKCTPPN